MCLIATSTSGFCELPRQFWRAAIAAFTDGLGVMYHDGARLVHKRFLAYDAQKLFAELEALPCGVRAAIHLREATYGARCPLNLHPHVLAIEQTGLELAVMHNGSVLALEADALSGDSDTRMLVQDWLRAALLANQDVWHSPQALARLAQFVGEQNRLVLLDNQGVWRVTGEELGFHHGQTWLSNRKVQPWLDPISLSR